jgi:hypothetical protein
MDQSEMKSAVLQVAQSLGKHPASVTYKDMESAGVSSRQIRHFIPWKKTLTGWFGDPNQAVVDLIQSAAQSEEFAVRHLAALEKEERAKGEAAINRRTAVGLARDMLVARRLEQIITKSIPQRIKPSGYAKKRVTKPGSRTVNLLLSDHHIGAFIDPQELPEGYDLLSAGRRLGKVCVETIDYKIQYRDKQHLNVLLNGDIIQGQLGHDQSEDLPGAEQFMAALHILIQMLVNFSAEFPTVKVWCQSGNHGRSILRHPKHATAEKWDSHETQLYYALKCAVGHIPNISFDIRRQPISIIPVYDKAMAMTHGDTVVKVANPRTGGSTYEQALERMNGNLTYGSKIDLLVIGHYHSPYFMSFKSGSALVNGALLPPNGFAMGLGYESSQCSQWIWESVEGHIYGDSRLIKVGPDDDKDGDLDDVIPPFVLFR